jgi:hypothetical protein
MDSSKVPSQSRILIVEIKAEMLGQPSCETWASGLVGRGEDRIDLAGYSNKDRILSKR